MKYERLNWEIGREIEEQFDGLRSIGEIFVLDMVIVMLNKLIPGIF